MRVRFLTAVILGVTLILVRVLVVRALQPTVPVKTLTSTTVTRTSDSCRNGVYAVS